MLLLSKHVKHLKSGSWCDGDWKKSQTTKKVGTGMVLDSVGGLCYTKIQQERQTVSVGGRIWLHCMVLQRNENTDWSRQTAATPTLCSESKSCHTCQFMAQKKICLLIWKMFSSYSKGSSRIKSNINISQLSEDKIPEHHLLHGKFKTASSCNVFFFAYQCEVQTCLAFVT